MADARGATLAEVVLHAAVQRPHDQALVFVHHTEGGVVRSPRTQDQLWSGAVRVASGLRQRGVQPGDRVAVVMANHPEFVELLVATGLGCFTVVPIDPRTPADRLAFMVGRAGCTAVVCSAEALPAVQAAAPACPLLRMALVVGAFARDAAGALQPEPYERLHDARTDSTLAETRAEPDEPMQILFTSGTTGAPKGIVFSHRKFTDTARLAAAAFGYTPQDRLYSGLSLTHANAQLVTLGAALVLGIPAVFSRRFSKGRLWETVRSEGCTSLTLLGGMTTAISCEPPSPLDRDHRVRMVVSAGMPAAIWRDFEQRFGVRVLEFWGTAEGGMTLNPPGVGPVGSIGRPPPSLAVRIVDEAGRDVPPGGRGQLLVRAADGTPFAVHYVGDPAASAAKCKDGWLQTGDVVHSDAQGWLYFDFRLGQGIRRNGDFIDAAAVEKALAETGLVDDAFVFGVPAASGAPGESDVIAAVVPRGGVTPVGAVAAALPRTVPLQYLLPVAAIPKTASEKPLARLLAQQVAEDPEALVPVQQPRR